MLVIPVIDLMGGQVVRARKGERASYRPIETGLAASSRPEDIAGALFALAPFPALYIADLDAIQSRGSHVEPIAAIRSRHPGIELWLDGGYRGVPELRAARALGVRPVIGTESLPGEDTLAAMLREAPDAVLSLDSRDGQPLGPPGLFQAPDRWPDTVIAMTLERIGTRGGPAMEKLEGLVRSTPTRRIVAAGGVSDAGDLRRLSRLGLHAVLVASAIHDGVVDRAALGPYLERPQEDIPVQRRH